MWRILDFFIVGAFASGLLLLPVLFGSASAIVALLIALFWLLFGIRTDFIRLSLPRFQMVWVIIAASFFILFSLSANSLYALIFGFNTIAFILALGVFWRAGPFCPRQISGLLSISFAGLLIGVAWAYYQHHSLGIARVTAYIGGGSNLVARIAILLANFSMILLITDVNRWSKLLGYVFGIGAASLVAIYAGSRGSLLALPLLVLLPIIFALPTKLLKSIPVWSLVFILGICVVGLSYWLDPNGLVTSTLERLQSVATGEDMDRSTELRYQMWQVAFQSFLEHPIVGTGWDSFIAMTEGTILESYAAKDYYFNFHSDIANFAVAGGVVGLLLYFLLLFAPLIFWETPKNHPYIRVRLYWAVTMPILYLVLGLTDMVMGFDYPTMFYAFTFAIIWGLTEQKNGLEIEGGAKNFT